MIALRDVSIYAKINSFGVVFILIIIVFTVGVGIYSLSNTAYTSDQATYDAYLAEVAAKQRSDYLAYIPLFSTPFAPLMGILGGGFYFHNISLSVIRNARNPENNMRDVFLGYVVTFLTYVLCGTLGCYGFLGSNFKDNLDENGIIQQNDLQMFSVTNNLATFIRFCAFAQLLTVNALLTSLERSQILLVITGKQEAPSMQVNLLMNACIMIGPFCLAIWYPQVGTVAGLGGSFATMLVVYFLPIFTHLNYRKSAMRNPEIAMLIKRSTFTSPSVSDVDKSDMKASSILEVK